MSKLELWYRDVLDAHPFTVTVWVFIAGIIAGIFL